MRPIPGLWRWRRNQLRRRSDVIEAWASLVTVGLVVIGAPVAGLAAGKSVGSDLQRTMQRQRAERHRTTARVINIDRHPAPVADSEAAHGQDGTRVALVRWRTPDGSSRTGVVRIEARHAVGDPLAVWTDRRGRLTERPLDASTATTNAVAAGFGVGGAAAALACGARQLLGWRIMRRRLADWAREWARVSEDWGRAGAGG
ncbi:Rv1733c family protein [Streptantibioticus ferralitis]|uniref:Uncharacterized protein n=1 Tax=Streptantibioticus ferralitis TaxID=236510 RepID=A0ABT5YXN0_9ACTN|nr:hypothetical protein [Streptantibioticus ferralitis]MDF2256319.1 hypothetical protein [Streptantibioticus ferralitis]